MSKLLPSEFEKPVILVAASLNKSKQSKKEGTVLRQIFAASLASSYHIVFGISLAYSAILNPELDKNTTDIQTTKDERSWVASVLTLAVPVGAPLGGVLMDNFGRLNTVRIASIPAVIGWVMIATSSSLWMLIAGRICTGLASALGTGPAIVYMTEIARSDIRGSLISFAPAYTSLGMVLAYIKGWAFGWRMTAWMCVAYSIAPFILISFIPESPVWLISKGKNEKAKKSLQWLTLSDPDPTEEGGKTLAESQFEQLKEANNRKIAANQNKKGITGVLRAFLKPTGYKPLLILMGMFIFQQFSGIYITLFYSVEFFQEVGTNINPYLSSILIGIVRAVMSVVNTYMLKAFHRRPLIVWSSLGMGVCMLVSGLFTHWIKTGVTSLNWIPVIAVMLYVVASMIGLLSIPWTMTAELFPIEIRGVAHSWVYSAAYLFMFFSVQNYHKLKQACHGIAGLQWFFAAVSIAGLFYSLLFLPETHGFELNEIEEYFKENTIYLCQKKKTTDSRKNAHPHRRPSGEIVRRNTLKTVTEDYIDQNEKLLVKS
ncbi:facilitated trehalose transporter Tret1-2 homolog isoform X1 [Harmonia axyridis]|uniref:facilitated trehalose transporter Tret1-2 homolog isoform X1 n=1 Tax=Harmonia axyridis TaxID=115357 RepID=UPI001E2799CD|nr:facilitated trehalose transporter Tret1-2 homolog isoform X1 [Harmonia axyridis]